METNNCINCGAPEQSLTEECKYCGHQPPVAEAPEPERAAAATQAVQIEGEISRFKLGLTSLFVGGIVMVIGQIIMGG